MANNRVKTSKIIRRIICFTFAMGLIAQSEAALSYAQQLPNTSFVFQDSTIHNSPNPFTQSNVNTTLTASIFTTHKQAKASGAAEAAQIAKQRYGGKVLSVNSKKTAGGVIYRVKLLLDDGRVKTVTING